MSIEQLTADERGDILRAGCGAKAIRIIDQLTEAVAARDTQVKNLQAATEVMSLAEQQLAAANALLEYMATEAPDTAIGEATMRLIRAHLSAKVADRESE